MTKVYEMRATGLAVLRGTPDHAVRIIACAEGADGGTRFLCVPLAWEQGPPFRVWLKSSAMHGVA